MRVRNPKTGTVVELDQETANAYIAVGWEEAETKSGSRSSTRDTGDSDEGDTRTRRRRASK